MAEGVYREAWHGGEERFSRKALVGRKILLVTPTVSY